MKKMLLILAAFLLNACGAVNHVVVDEKTDEISTILVENNHLYVLSTIHDYEFNDPELVKDLPKFLSSKYATQLSNIDIAFKISKNGDVTGGYTLFISPEKLSENDIQYLTTSLGFEKKDYSDTSKPRSTLIKTYGYKYELTPQKKLDYEKNDKPNGRIVALKNKNAITQNYQLTPRPKVKLLYSETQTDVGMIALSGAAIALSAPFVVVTLPISAPLMIGCILHDGPCN